VKKIIICLIIIFYCFAVSGCADNKMINGHDYDTYGLLNKDDYKDDNIKYRLSYGNLIWSFIFVETIIAPVYFIGFSLYEPICKKTKK